MPHHRNPKTEIQDRREHKPDFSKWRTKSIKNISKNINYYTHISNAVVASDLAVDATLKKKIEEEEEAKGELGNTTEVKLLSIA